MLEHSSLKPYLESCDHWDVKTVSGSVTLRQFVSNIMSYNPKWLMFLFKIREVVAKVLRLKDMKLKGPPPKLSPENVSFEKGDMAGFFEVVAGKNHDFWIAKAPDDKHLDAFIAIVCKEKDLEQTQFHLLTIVNYKHWTGPVYFNMIRPFHHVIVKMLTKAGIKR